MKLVKTFNYQIMKNQFVYYFNSDRIDGNASMRNLLGGKGANLAEMSQINIPVPPGFTITTEACNLYYEENRKIPQEIITEIELAIQDLERISGKKFGDHSNPLLVSVRSGARISMPGMMDTVLNLGMNDEVAETIGKITGDLKFTYDTYRRFLQMYGNVVLGVDGYLFEEVLETKKEELYIENDTDFSVDDLKDIIQQFKQIINQNSTEKISWEPKEQLFKAIESVFNSWRNHRAQEYRKINNIPSEWGTAVNIQSMVFGNFGNDCATGVAFTRDPSTGENRLYGEYLINAQGEDVVAGVRTPQQINKAGCIAHKSSLPSMEETMPELYAEFCTIYRKLETHYGDMQDIEFTIEKGILWILQTRSGKRGAKAAIKIAIDLHKEGFLTKQQAINSITPQHIENLLHPTFDPNHNVKPLTKGLAASPGGATGMVVFNNDDAQEFVAKKCKVILIRLETSPEDIVGMNVSEGILTARGGMTSHAAVVARGMGKPCICGATTVKVDNLNKCCYIEGYKINQGDIITINGSTGEVFPGEIPMITPDLSHEFQEFMDLVLEHQNISVRANAETVEDIQTALNFSITGIGLCRTEHMFFDKDRILQMRKMIFATNIKERQIALDQLEPYQEDDFVQIFNLIKSLPINIRLLDPPLHEFLPTNSDETQQMAIDLNVSLDKVQTRLLELHEVNPMLGHRGCRLGISFPEIYNMQIQAIFNAARKSYQQHKEILHIEIMIPLIIGVTEFNKIKESIQILEKELIPQELKDKIDISIGTMIETPRSALTSGDIADNADYFSFGTNDLTQTTLSLSRDDSTKLIEEYLEKKIFLQDPFVSIDKEGVGELVRISCEKARKTKPDIKLGICGEHGGDPESIKFFKDLKLDYISCSPYRVPIAQLISSQTN